jgi:hypothetical protein
MNLNVHFQVVVPDGVFTAAKSAARADFWRLPTPERMDLETLTVNVEMRVVSWLRHDGFPTVQREERTVIKGGPRTSTPVIAAPTAQMRTAPAATSLAASTRG